VVVVCESCSTHFQVDEGRIPPKGTLVRCSRCKSTFIVKPPSASPDETIRDIVADIVEAGGTPVPEPAEDLFDVEREDLGQTATRPAGPPDEEKWEFDEEPRKHGVVHSEGATRERRPQAPMPLAEDIGKPEEWDLLGDSVELAAREAEYVEPPAPPVVAQRRAEPERAPRRRRAPELGRSVVEAGRFGVRSVAWLALAGLSALSVTKLVPSGSALVLAAEKPAHFALADGEARSVHGRFVENAFASTLFVVQGELSRPHADARLGLRVRWTGAGGARLGEGEWAGPARPLRELRERAPEALRRELADGAPLAALGGPFVAVFASVPAEATGFALELAELPAPVLPAPPLLPDEAAGAGPEAGPAAEPTASSPPSPRPSSG
jgi:predicted Zn finger-like uncharacterized protein